LAGTGALVDAPAFHGYLSGRRNLAALALLAGAGAPPRAEIDRLLERVGLADRADDRVSGYSTGMRQRLGLAAALMGRPRLLILDEPTSGLDPQGRDEILELVRHVASEDGPAVLFTSHIFDEAARLCDRVGILSAGALAYEGAAGEPERLREIFFAETGSARGRAGEQAS
jgi:ABC-2 type transport system ATP-binding protein